MDYQSVPLDDPDEMIKWLDSLFPDKCPLENDTERAIWIKVGMRKAAYTIIAKIKHMQRKDIEGE